MSKNKKNEGKKRPVCVCGSEMTYVEFEGYYDNRKFWICKNSKCDATNLFEPDEIDIGMYA